MGGRHLGGQKMVLACCARLELAPLSLGCLGCHCPGPQQYTRMLRATAVITRTKASCHVRVGDSKRGESCCTK